MILQKCSLGKMIVRFLTWMRHRTALTKKKLAEVKEKRNKTWLLLKVGVTSGMH